MLALNVAIRTVLFLCTTDNVTDSDGVSHTVFVYEGFALPHAILRLAGRDPTEKLTKILSERVFSFTATAEREIAWDIIKELCYIGARIDGASSQGETYELPDGNIIIVGAQRLRCVNVLFQTNFIGEGASGIHDTYFQCHEV